MWKSRNGYRAKFEDTTSKAKVKRQNTTPSVYIALVKQLVYVFSCGYALGLEPRSRPQPTQKCCDCKANDGGGDEGGMLQHISLGNIMLCAWCMQRYTYELSLAKRYWVVEKSVSCCRMELMMMKGTSLKPGEEK
ncbi:hypothetical protein PV326_004483 [Microctonus aethiopoides]|nr:hypothetical protein PV326_004483 [Microctonus aethiopoides]